MRTGKVALIYTGGTLGMVRSARGFTPSQNLRELFASRIPEIGSAQLPNFDLVAFGEAADSADFAPRTWYELSDAIRNLLPGCDGVVVIHGTDTMAYTASALSFLLGDTRVPVVLTGSQLPLGELRSDARTNLLTALEVAASKRLRDVAISFGHHVLRGNRATKVQSLSFDAFESPNFPPLASVGAEVRYRNLDPVAALPEDCLPRADYRDVRIAVLPVYPGLDGATARSIAGMSPDGLILECYGVGTFPARHRDLLSTLEALVKSGTVVVAVSQCLTGGAMLDRYSAGHLLADCGVVSGGDMTREAAYAKLHFLHACDLSKTKILQYMGCDLRGEVTEGVR